MVSKVNEVSVFQESFYFNCTYFLLLCISLLLDEALVTETILKRYRDTNRSTLPSAHGPRQRHYCNQDCIEERKSYST